MAVKNITEKLDEILSSEYSTRGSLFFQTTSKINYPLSKVKCFCAPFTLFDALRVIFSKKLPEVLSQCTKGEVDPIEKEKTCPNPAPESCSAQLRPAETADRG
jgi:hypothetical protein